MKKADFKKQKFDYDDIVEAVKYGINYGADESEKKLSVPEGNIQQWLAATKLRSSEEWQQLFPEVVVIDEDGWRNLEGSYKKRWYEELISYQEYIQRRDESTCQFKKE